MVYRGEREQVFFGGLVIKLRQMCSVTTPAHGKPGSLLRPLGLVEVLAACRRQLPHKWDPFLRPQPPNQELRLFVAFLFFKAL